ncbi:Uncharacterised protein [Corynebacterium renale]|uniref:Uncharacterized protein n=1 Tax=Corynebacterium renale TaxID=1724 RepID=A0A2A9DQ45_9CORY|nr:hypothetical protein [Corynebacterium renale]PFG28039.1 hypothetical protein ATK06_1122 [Corynebacterium renale]SQG65374.1 Uncharacterised protein [Corynebacterium renale]SQI21171.1 Uncharacterised protein [Corynebacterium renale]STC99047.1 Uncharacterised protein [Corynebacterium renale]
MNEINTWCFLTVFVCRYDQLDQAKARHQRCVDVLRETNTVHFSSEQAYNNGHSEPIFGLLLSEIIPPGEKINSDEEQKYSAFTFITIVDVPHTPDTEYDSVYVVGQKLQIDFEEGIPARFPSRTRGIIVSRTGHEIDGCICQ